LRGIFNFTPMLYTIILQSGYNQPNDNVTENFGFWFFLPFIIGGIYWLKIRKADYDWKNGIFDSSLPYSRDNLLEAYIYLAAQLIAKDRDDVSGKIKYISSYFRKYFKTSNYDFRESLTAAYRNPERINAVSSWLNFKVRKKSERIQIIYFLAGLCMVDGRLVASELKLLETIAFFLKVSPKEFQSVIGMYQSYEKSSRESFKSKVSPTTRRALSCKILGVSEKESFDEIKKAYRKMVKLHHPDKFHNASSQQRKIAKEKFISVQKAYEYLENIK